MIDHVSVWTKGERKDHSGQSELQTKVRFEI